MVPAHCRTKNSPSIKKWSRKDTDRMVPDRSCITIKNCAQTGSGPSDAALQGRRSDDHIYAGCLWLIRARYKKARQRTFLTLKKCEPSRRGRTCLIFRGLRKEPNPAENRQPGAGDAPQGIIVGGVAATLPAYGRLTGVNSKLITSNGFRLSVTR